MILKIIFWLIFPPHKLSLVIKMMHFNGMFVMNVNSCAHLDLKMIIAM